jgi:hypothetical protein
VTRLQRALSAVFAATPLFLSVACSPTVPAAPTLNGTVEVPAYGPGLSGYSETCEPWTPYLDVQPGAKVSVTNEAGTQVGSGSLGVPADNASAYSSDKKTCIYVFESELSTGEADFYTLTIAAREGPTYSRQELIDSGWAVNLSIGF